MSNWIKIGWQKLWAALTNWVAPEPEPAPAPAKWYAYVAAEWCQHGNAGENAYREGAIKGCRAAGFDCLQFTMHSVPNAELSMHLFHYQSPVDGHFMGRENWHNRAVAAGISRWQVILSDGIAGNSLLRDEIKDRFKAYTVDMVQFLVSAENLKAAQDTLGKERVIQNA